MGSQSSLNVNFGTMGGSASRSSPLNSSPSVAEMGPTAYPFNVPSSHLPNAFSAVSTGSKENSPVRATIGRASRSGIQYSASAALFGMAPREEDKGSSRISLVSRASRASASSGGQRLAERWLDEREREREREKRDRGGDVGGGSSEGGMFL
jgi:hypothetical protein